MNTTLLALGAIVALPLLSFSPSSAAQNAAQDGVLVIYGDDKCPTNADGDEIVVCVRRPAEERYRIPKDLRDQEVQRENQAWATRVDDAMSVGNTGIGSCTTVGGGGGLGCNAQAIHAGKAEADARRKAEKVLPE